MFFRSFCRRKKNQKGLGDFNALRLRLRLNGKSPKRSASHRVYALRAPGRRRANNLIFTLFKQQNNLSSTGSLPSPRTLLPYFNE